MAKKAKYRVRNWSEYNKALVNRGSITVWVSDELINSFGKQGDDSAHGNQVYSNNMIELCLVLKQVYGRTLRATQGLVG